ncbi:MAG: HlyD family efflux transporter periplasmic adaptor subunit [Candidatus Tectomicrobia bacterium]
MAEEPERRRHFTLVTLIQRAVRRPYLFMAAVVLVIGVIWFFRLAVQEFLLLDRLVNVYTNDAQVQMNSYAIRPAITAEVLEVLAQEGKPVRKGAVLLRLAQDDILTELGQAEAVADEMAQQLQERRQELPLALERARNEIVQAQAVVATKQLVYRRAQMLLTVERDRTDKGLREHQASIEAARARQREHETAAREAEMTLQRNRSLFQDGIVSQDRLDATQIAVERYQARLAAAQEDVRQVQEHYPSGISPHMIRVHEQDVRRLAAEVKEQQAGLELARNNLRMVALGPQRLKVLEARHKEALTQVEVYRLKLAKTFVRSPIDGIVAYRNIEPGETVEGDPSNSPVLVINDPRHPWIAANVWESDIDRVHIGDTAEIWIDALKTSVLGRGKPVQGRVVRINPTTYSEVVGLPPERFFTRRERKIPVGIAIESNTLRLRAGMLAEVLILPGDGAEAEEQHRQ